MSDIFISYSRKDAEQVHQLTTLLESAGLAVWIDKQSIPAASSWSREIVNAIKECSVFLLVLSTHSIESHNVIKEVSLASEKGKRILPLELEPVTLPEELEYQLAGLQRSQFSNIDSILRGLSRLGLTAEAAVAPPIATAYDDRKSVMVLPFADLSPTRDNEWFADGLVSELISTLSQIKSLRVAQFQKTVEYKQYQGTLVEYAHEMRTRYFIEGEVRKFGDSIKINARLLDIESGDFLWQEAMKGTMDAVFDMQEQLARKVTGGLAIVLTNREQHRLARHDVRSTEAYELYLRAASLVNRNTLESFLNTIHLAKEAIAIDERFASAHAMIGSATLLRFFRYERDPELLKEAEHHLGEALRIDPDQSAALSSLALLHQITNDDASAEEVLKRLEGIDPFAANFRRGHRLMVKGQWAEACAEFLKAVEIQPDNLGPLWNLVLSAHRSGEGSLLIETALKARPAFQRHYRLHPEDETFAVKLAIVEYFAGNEEHAKAFLPTLRLHDPAVRFDAACLAAKLDMTAYAIDQLQRAIEKDPAVRDRLSDPDLDSLRGMPEFVELAKNETNISSQVERVSAEG